MAADADVAVAPGPLGPADEAAATAGATLAVGLPGLGVPALDGVAPTLPALPAPAGDVSLDGLLGAIDAPPSDGTGGQDTSTGGISAPDQSA